MSDISKKTKNIPLPTNFGKNLKFLRRLKGISQGSLADQLSLTRSKVASYESGLVEPNVHYFLKVCEFFAVEPNDMLELVLSKDPSETVSVDTSQLGILETFHQDHLSEFVIQTNELSKILEGYKAYYEMNEPISAEGQTSPFYPSLQDLIKLMDTLVKSNWTLIQNIYPQEEE